MKKEKMITEPSPGHISGKNPLNLQGRIIESGLSVFKVKF